MAKADNKRPGSYRAPTGYLVNLPATIFRRRADQALRDALTVQVPEVGQSQAVAYLSLPRFGGRHEASVP
jgi:hypothetical protein